MPSNYANEDTYQDHRIGERIRAANAAGGPYPKPDLSWANNKGISSGMSPTQVMASGLPITGDDYAEWVSRRSRPVSSGNVTDSEGKPYIPKKFVYPEKWDPNYGQTPRPKASNEAGGFSAFQAGPEERQALVRPPSPKMNKPLRSAASQAAYDAIQARYDAQTKRDKEQHDAREAFAERSRKIVEQIDADVRKNRQNYLEGTVGDRWDDPEQEAIRQRTLDKLNQIHSDERKRKEASWFADHKTRIEDAARRARQVEFDAEIREMEDKPRRDALAAAEEYRRNLESEKQAQSPGILDWLANMGLSFLDPTGLMRNPDKYNSSPTNQYSVEPDQEALSRGYRPY